MEDVREVLRIAASTTKNKSLVVPRRENRLVPASSAGDLTRHQQQLIDAAAEIRERWAFSSELSFMAKHLVQLTLPHRDPGDVPLWTRANGSNFGARTGHEL
jgi:hypothetical protein